MTKEQYFMMDVNIIKEAFRSLFNLPRKQIYNYELILIKGGKYEY